MSCCGFENIANTFVWDVPMVLFQLGNKGQTSVFIAINNFFVVIYQFWSCW